VDYPLLFRLTNRDGSQKALPRAVVDIIREAFSGAEVVLAERRFTLAPEEAGRVFEVRQALAKIGLVVERVRNADDAD
jgi:hypothetical protein